MVCISTHAYFTAVLVAFGIQAKGHCYLNLAPRSGGQGDGRIQAELVQLAAQQVADAGLGDAKAPCSLCLRLALGLH